jgi:hypothetical protein
MTLGEAFTREGLTKEWRCRPARRRAKPTVDKPMPSDKEKRERDQMVVAQTEDALDRALEATFPASDPPAIPNTRIGEPRRPRPNPT